MKTDYQQKNAQVLTTLENLKKDIQNITEEEYIQFLSLASQFHNYSFNNILLIYSQYPEASQVASFKKWKEKNRFVKKGEKAIKILAPIIYKTTTKHKVLQEKNNNTNEDKMQLWGFISVPVFDISQTEWKCIERGMTVSSDTLFEEILAFVNDIDSNLTIELKPLQVKIGGSYNRSESLIVLNKNLNKIENTSTLLHELSHHLLEQWWDDESSRTEDEQEAETLTHLFCNHFGVERKSKFYLKWWGGVSENLEKIINIYKENI